MSSRIRFTEARDVYEAFANLKRLAAPPRDASAPLDHARTLLASPRPTEAIIFIAHLLPRREAVWWAVQCVRAMLDTGSDDEALHAAEAWVRDPEDDTRRKALAVAQAGDERAATTWLAFAASWSGGSISASDQAALPAPPFACAMAANTAVMLAACAGDPLGLVQRVRACAEAGIRFAEGGDATVLRPAEAPTKPAGFPAPAHRDRRPG